MSELKRFNNVSANEMTLGNSFNATVIFTFTPQNLPHILSGAALKNFTKVFLSKDETKKR